MGGKKAIQTIKIVAKKQRSSREEKEKLTSSRLSNSSCNLVTSNRLSKSIYKKLNQCVLNPKGGNWMFWWGDDKSEREREREEREGLIDEWKQFGFNGKVIKH